MSFLIGFIIMSVLVVILESLVHFFRPISGWRCRYCEYVFTAFFAFAVSGAYFIPRREPKRCLFSFFGIVDLLATYPVVSGVCTFLPVHVIYLLCRTFRLIRVFRVFKLFNFLEEGNLLLVSLRLSSRKIFVFFLLCTDPGDFDRYDHVYGGRYATRYSIQ